ncbi:MAG: hypothetical protein ACRER1_05120 [Gammaproteobacteria bacterium]
MIMALNEWIHRRVQTMRDRFGCRLLGIRYLPLPPKVSGKRLVAILSATTLQAGRDYAWDFPCSINETINVVLSLWLFEREQARADQAEGC